MSYLWQAATYFDLQTRMVMSFAEWLQRQTKLNCRQLKQKAEERAKVEQYLSELEMPVNQKAKQVKQTTEAINLLRMEREIISEL